MIFKRIAVFGDAHGVPELLRLLPRDRIAGVVAAGIRPQYLSSLELIARRAGLPLLVQTRRGDQEYRHFVESFLALGADGALCHSYSMVVPPEVLRSLRYQALNVHAALLPRNRGPNPVQWALIHGDARTGVTLHFMSDSIDEGDIVAQTSVEITSTDTWVSLAKRLDAAASALLEEEIPKILHGDFARMSQDASRATRNPRLAPDSPRIDFAAMSDLQVFNLIRAQVEPLSGAFIEENGKNNYFRSALSLQEVAALRVRFRARTGAAPC